MLKNIQLKRDQVLFIALASGLLLLALQLYVSDSNLLIPLSSLFHRHPPYMPLFNEYVPLALMLLILMWIKIGKLTETKHEMSRLNKKDATLIISSFILISLIFFRVWDIIAMVTYPHDNNQLFLESFSEGWMHIFFFFGLTILLLGFFFSSYGWKGLTTMFFPAIIPAFYTFNTNVVMYADHVSSFAVFYPIYQLILELGKFETLAISGLLKVFGINNMVNVNIFPYTLFVGGTRYLVDLPCIGWEGVAGYTIIFLIFVLELKMKKTMKLFWAIIGFVGTLFINLLRLSLIFVAGAVWGAETASLIHYNAGDIIFLVWILLFIYFITSFSNRLENLFTRIHHSIFNGYQHKGATNQ